MIELLITFLVGLACGFLFYKLGVPGGMMVGSIVGVSALSILSGVASMPAEAKLAAQCMAGAFIACSVEQSDIKNLPKVLRPALVLLGAMLCLNLILGMLIWLCSPLDMITSFMCAVPGGMSDTPLIAADLGADAAKVAVLQFVRMSAGIGIFPSLIARLTKNEPAEPKGDADAAKRVNSGSAASFLQTIAVAAACGVLGKYLGVPAGALVFSMLGVIALKMLFGKAYLPLWAKRLAQVLSGSYIGCGITRADILELRFLLLPAVILLAGYFINSIITGRLLKRLFAMPLKTAMLTATPAGATDMALISADLGVDSKELIEMQIIRMIVVISVFPQIIFLIVKTFGGGAG